MSRRLALIAILVFIHAGAAAEPPACIASMPLGSFNITVRPPASGEPRPLREVNAIGSGSVIAYRPVRVAPDMVENGRVALILVPEDPGAKLEVFEPHAAAVPAQWVAPYRVAAVGLVMGPHGLDHDKVLSRLNKDRELMAQLAEYAAQTERVEMLVQALAAAEQGSGSVDAVLTGFAERYGSGVSKLDRKAPTDQQAQTLLRAVLPSISTYDPLATQPSARMQQSAGLAASFAGLFLGTNVGLAAGGAAMAQNLRTLMFPATDFRSALAQPAESGAVALCAARQPRRSRTRQAYLWAHRVPGGAPPEASLRSPLNVLRGTRPLLAIDGDWRRLERAREWALTSGAERVPVSVRPTPQGLELDLVRAAMEPGDWQISALWDWQAFNIGGELHVYATPDLSKAQLRTPLIEGSGPVFATVTGGDFRFVTEARLGERQVDFKITDTLRFNLDTSAWKAGRYRLAFKQADSSIQEIPVRVLPPNPRIANAPVRANIGETLQTVTLRGAGLERIERVEASGADIQLAPAQPGSETREATVRLGENARPGDRLNASLRIEGLDQPLETPGLIEVAGPRPRIDSVEVSLPDDLGVALREGELPAGSFASLSMRVENAGERPALHLHCGDAPITLRAGDQRGRAKLETAGANVLFLSLDAGSAGRPGCALSASLDGPTGASDARALGRVVRLPRIEGFMLSDDKAGESAYYGVLTGQDLELIERTGWDANTGLAVESLPKPVGDRQSLRVTVPWPSPSPRAPLFVWLRGEREGRPTKARQ